MLAKELDEYFEKPCRLKLKSGKEVFGVVWEEKDHFNNANYFFASSDGYESYKKAFQTNDKATCEKIKIPIDIDDVVGAELLKGIIPGKNMFL